MWHLPIKWTHINKIWTNNFLITFANINLMRVETCEGLIFFHILIYGWKHIHHTWFSYNEWITIKSHKTTIIIIIKPNSLYVHFSCVGMMPSDISFENCTRQGPFQTILDNFNASYNEKSFSLSLWFLFLYILQCKFLCRW